MKKIFNWTIGSAFRTIGRFIGLLLISLLFGLLLVKSDIHITDLFGIGRVYADTAQTFSTSQVRIYTDNAGTITSSSWYDNPHTFSPSYPVTSMQLRLKSSNGFKAENSYKFKFSFLPSPDAINASGVTFNDGTNTFTSVNCSGWGREGNGYYANICYISPLSNISSSNYMYVNITFNAGYLDTIRSWVGTFEEYTGTGAIVTEQAGNIIDNSNQNTQDIINANNQNTQSQIENANCPIGPLELNYNTMKYIDGKYLNEQGEQVSNSDYYITKYINVKPNTTYKIRLGGSLNNPSVCQYRGRTISSLINCNKYGGNLETIITTSSNTNYLLISVSKLSSAWLSGPVCNNWEQESQNETNNQLNDLNDTLTDDNINDSDISNSLNYSVGNNAYGPFATFLTLPLQWVQDILASNQSCRPLSLPLPFVNQNLVIPCMTDFWNSTGALGTLIQLCWIAVVGVRIFNGLFKLVVDTTSSEDNAEELTKIRSWEL